MEQRELLTAKPPPFEIFTREAAKFQKHYEAPTQGNYLEKIDYPPEGGIFVHYYDHPFPSKGQPFPEVVITIMQPKKIILATIKFFKRHFILAGLLLASSWVPILSRLTRKIVKSALDCYIRDFAHDVIIPYILEEKRFCRSVREIRRAGKVAIEKVDSYWKEYHFMFLDIVSSICEWDNAYRYRMQATVQDHRLSNEGALELFFTIDKAAFSKNPSREIARLAAIHVRRERGWHEDKGRFIMIAKAARALLFFNPELKKVLVEFVNELNLEEVKLDEADQYFNLNRADYDVYGWPMELRWKKYKELFEGYQKANQDRIRKGQEKVEQAQILTEIRNRVTEIEGIPVVMFYAVREGEKENEVRVKFVETPMSLTNPHLLSLCKGIIEAKERKDAQKNDKK